MGDQLREKDCTILNPTPKWKEGNRETMFVKYYNDSRSVPEFAALVEMKHRENTFNLVCFPLLNDAFPIEVMRELDISAKEAEQYAFTVCQLERLMKTRIYKHASPDDLPYAPKCIFFVKWFNEEIRIAISREHCDNKKSWSYTTHPLQYDYAEKDRARILPKGSKLLLPFPKVKENDENDILY